MQQVSRIKSPIFIFISCVRVHRSHASGVLLCRNLKRFHAQRLGGQHNKGPASKTICGAYH